MEVYLDNSATTEVFSEILEIMRVCLTIDYGNPSSLHKMGLTAEKRIKEARHKVKKALGDDSGTLIFTSGGTEANNMAIRGSVKNKKEICHFITTKIEHPSVLECFKQWEKEGHEVTYLDVNDQGEISATDIKNALRENTRLVSIMHVNNEVGSIQPIEEIGKIIKSHFPNCLFHVDGVQAFGKLKTRVKRLGVDLYTVSGHKVHGPKGIGALYVKKGIKLEPLFYGGGQEGGYRPGTENVPAIAGFGVAAEKAQKGQGVHKIKIESLKKYFWESLSNGVDGICLNGNFELGAPHILNISFQGVRGEVLLHELASRGVFASTGSACSSKKKIHSSVLTAMGLCSWKKEGAIRFTLHAKLTEKEIDYAVEEIRKSVQVLRAIIKGRA